MIIEIRKTEFQNKGAELMLYAILEKMRTQYPKAKFVMTPYEGLAPFEKRIKLGLYQKATFWKFKIRWDFLFIFLPKKFKRLYGLVDNTDIDVVLDASGFSYTDQWGINSTLELENATKTWKKNNTTIILLPQAFGPFKNNKIKKLMQNSIKNSDLIFAREEISFNYLNEITDSKEKILMYPDFTNLIKGKKTNNFNLEENKFCIIPNYRMLDKTTKEEKNNYIPFLVKCIKYLQKKDQRPFLLIHEGDKDFQIAKEINSKLNDKINIIIETDSLNIKGIIGNSTGLISSRFHGLVSGLSQAIPSLATGWSHKYEMLFNDYNFKEGLLNVNSSEQIIHEKIDLIIEKESKEKITANLNASSIILKNKSEEMWEKVYIKIDERNHKNKA